MRGVAEAGRSLVAIVSFAAVMTPLAASANEIAAPLSPCIDGAQQHAAAPAVAPKVMTLKEAAAATGMLVKMTEATKLAGLDDPEVDVGPLTLLAPSDEAFNALPQDIRDRLLAPENRALLTDLLLYHAVPGLYSTDRLLKAKVRNYTISAIEGSAIEINKRRKTGEIDIAGAKILRSETASDGIIHVIDKVLIPPAVMAALTAPPSMGPAVIAEGDQ
ncbi:MAG: fasciclin domain-containing protein [Hyphomicrobium sp.]|nr:fasciclin domain-containing protein [Hyphomicrobium sp.]